ncbi:hypothetical protein E8E12_006186 [Didymella heteroderae]|uniref:Uncharacterized protein n=1 Tax=Didymella heteroderae TaxID=1769908 RepID=A0A9P4WJY4_9PLEO|nr:hypothetical protein E8E12_006186 [Didymella heteroderae]
MDIDSNKEVDDEAIASSSIELVLEENPSLSDVFDTFCMNGSSYGEKLQAVNQQRLCDTRSEPLTPERLFQLLQMLRPNRFCPMVTFEEAFESGDADVTETINQPTSDGHS